MLVFGERDESKELAISYLGELNSRIADTISLLDDIVKILKPIMICSMFTHGS
jgi:hypothetical protein